MDKWLSGSMRVIKVVGSFLPSHTPLLTKLRVRISGKRAGCSNSIIASVKNYY